MELIQQAALAYEVHQSVNESNLRRWKEEQKKAKRAEYQQALDLVERDWEMWADWILQRVATGLDEVSIEPFDPSNPITHSHDQGYDFWHPNGREGNGAYSSLQYAYLTALGGKFRSHLFLVTERKHYEEIPYYGGFHHCQIAVSGWIPERRRI